MSNDSGSSPPAPGDQYREAITQYRTSVKWVVSSFGAVAAALIVGIQLTSLGQLEGTRLTVAFICIALAFVAILVIVGMAVRVLVPESGTYAGFAHDKEFEPLRSFLAKDSAPLRDKATSAADLATKYELALDAENKLWSQYQSDKANATLKNQYTTKQREREDLYQVLIAVTALGLFLRVKKMFQQTMIAIGIGTLIAAAGAVGFAYAANPPSPKPEPTTEKVEVSLASNKSCDAVHPLAEGQAKTPQLLSCGLGRPELLSLLKYLSHHH